MPLRLCRLSRADERCASKKGSRERFYLFRLSSTVQGKQFRQVCRLRRRPDVRNSFGGSFLCCLHAARPSIQLSDLYGDSGSVNRCRTVRLALVGEACGFSRNVRVLRLSGFLVALTPLFWL